MAASACTDILTLGTGKSSLPELVGVNGEAAAATIVRENPKVAVTVIVKEGMMVTMDFHSDRVRVWVDKNGTVEQTPQIG
ncbi:glu S.griseus protease inhibitor-like [Corylus avellana]|uniref:glu S.griseus protease inhibitor-like n=1 Tax=Corylus avellana TaxID=13451 RepID=UPI001E20DBDE|nr:glu S.griseus protease inhibitor-like [Corylus avellana]